MLDVRAAGCAPRTGCWQHELRAAAARSAQRAVAGGVAAHAASKQLEARSTQRFTRANRVVASPTPALPPDTPSLAAQTEEPRNPRRVAPSTSNRAAPRSTNQETTTPAPARTPASPPRH